MSRKTPTEVSAYGLKAVPAWRDARLETSDVDGRPVYIHFGSPNALRCLRTELQKIETHWQKQLGG